MEELVQELQEKLRKSEASRVKLRDSLRQLKERAVDTSDLVRQHQQLQAECSQKAQEAEEHKLARERLEKQLEAANNASPETRHLRREDADSARRLQTRLEKTQQTAIEASATARKSEHECANLHKQSGQLRERIKEVEHKQKATIDDVVHLKEQLGKQAAALQSTSQRLNSVLRQQAACASQQDMASLAEQVTRLESLAAASLAECEAARTDRDRLWQRLEAMQAQARASQEQQAAVLQHLSRWQSAFGAFAREVSGSPRVRRVGGDLAGNFLDDGAVAGEPTGGKQLVPYSSNDSASSGSHSSGRVRQTAVVPCMPGDVARVDEPSSKGAHTSTGTVAGPGEASLRRDRADAYGGMAVAPPAKRQRLDTAGSGGDEGSNAVRTPTGTVLTPRQHHEQAQAAAAQPNSEHGLALHRLTPEAEGGSAASGTAVTKAWKCESAAVSVVEGWLGEITSCVEHTVTDALARGAAAGLRDALAAGQCPLSCVVAGFETALLECAAPRGVGCSLLEDCAGDAASSGSVQGKSIEDIPFSTVWCRREMLQSRCFTGLLVCAQALGKLLLQSRAQQQEGFMEMLLQRLHAAAVRPPPGLHTALHTPACSAAAACAALYCAQGHLQAMRVLLFDLATAEAELSARMLPRLAAAVLAWPAALAPDPGHPSDGVLGPMLLAAMHDLSSSALQDHGRAADDTVTAAGSVSGTTSATELLPGVSAAAGALLAVCKRSGFCAKTGAQDHDRWLALLAALRCALRSALAMAANGTAQPEAWQCLACALRVATMCLGAARCREEAAVMGACSIVATNLDASERAKLGWE